MKFGVRFGFALVCLLAATACSHTITRLGRNCEGPGGWCPETRAVAAASWEYAQLSQNSYWEDAEDSDKPDDQLFVLPDDLKERFASADDRFGFAYSLFDRFEDGKLVEVVLVYRGTEGLKDWLYGNILSRQSERGMIIYNQVREGMDNAGYASVPLTLAGHSLGGRIADHVMKKVMRENGALPDWLSSYVFNPNAGGSALREGVGGKNGPLRISVAESGDIAGWVRAFAPDKQWDGYVIDCQPTINPMANHKIKRLADCLTWVAALDSEEARLSVTRNELKAPPVERDVPADVAHNAHRAPAGG